MAEPPPFPTSRSSTPTHFHHRVSWSLAVGHACTRGLRQADAERRWAARDSFRQTGVVKNRRVGSFGFMHAKAGE